MKLLRTYVSVRSLNYRGNTADADYNVRGYRNLRAYAYEKETRKAVNNVAFNVFAINYRKLYVLKWRDDTFVTTTTTTNV